MVWLQCFNSVDRDASARVDGNPQALKLPSLPVDQATIWLVSEGRNAGSPAKIGCLFIERD